MYEPVSLPYFRDPSTDHLPTIEQIRACDNVLHERYAAKIVSPDERTVVKFGISLDPREGQTLVYLERHVPKVPAPRLLAMYYDSRQLFLVMQRVPGVQLHFLWPSLTDSEKDGITARLRQIFDTLRQSRCPSPTFFGGVAGDGVYHHLFFSQQGESKHLGPFVDEPAFVKGLTDNFLALKKNNDHPLFKAKFYEDNLNSVLKNHRPTLTHGDIQRRNILVMKKDIHQRSGNGGGDREFDIVLIDWEAAGWMPEFWEYFISFTASELDDPNDDWLWRISQFLSVWLAETATLRMVERDF